MKARRTATLGRSDELKPGSVHFLRRLELRLGAVLRLGDLGMTDFPLVAYVLGAATALTGVVLWRLLVAVL